MNDELFSILVWNSMKGHTDACIRTYVCLTHSRNGVNSYVFNILQTFYQNDLRTFLGIISAYAVLELRKKGGERSTSIFFSEIVTYIYWIIQVKHLKRYVLMKIYFNFWTIYSFYRKKSVQHDNKRQIVYIFANYHQWWRQFLSIIKVLFLKVWEKQKGPSVYFWSLITKTKNGFPDYILEQIPQTIVLALTIWG